MRAHNAIHGREIAKMLKAPPQDFGSRLVTATATDKPAELRNPTDGRVAQLTRAWRCWGLCRDRYLLGLNVQVRIPALEDAGQFPVQHPHSRL